MSYILDLAIELPVYQRSTVYVYNTNVINPDSVPDIVNPYSSPLDRIWELEFGENAFSGSGNVNIGLIFAIVCGLIAAAGIAFAVFYALKVRSERSPMLAYAATLSEIEAGTVKLPGQPKEKKEKKKKVKKPHEEIEKGEEEC